MRSNPDRRRWSAWDAVVAVFVAVAVAVLVAAPSALSSAERCEHEGTREALTTVLRPAAALSRSLGLDSALGHVERMLGQETSPSD